MLFSELVAVSAEVGATRSRKAKTALLTAALRRLAGDELAAGVAFLSGEPRQDRLDLGPSAVGGVEVAAADTATLTVREVDDVLQRIADVAAGTGSRARRLALLRDLLGRATADEQDYLRRLVLRELRQGALAGVLTPAIATTADVPEAAVRRAAMLTGDLRRTAVAALTGGADALARFGLEIGTPLQPMLARTATSVAEAVGELGEVVVDAKLDGARVQVHRDGDRVRVFTRNRLEVTSRVPEVVAVARSLPLQAVVLDGETLALDGQGRPRAFQDTMQRFGREHDLEAASADVPLQVRFFDVLHLDGRDVLDLPLRDRLEVLARAVPAALRIDQLVTSDAADAQAFLRATLEAGHEGVMVKDLDAPYEAGRRGAAWRKVKPVHTLELVVLAAEWGSGRRRGWLSNLHLGAYDPDTDGFVMLGKTFKGLTDELLGWQTEQLLARQTTRDGPVVHVRPELVVEIALDGLVRSPRYPAGLAMRFARVRGYRPDKAPRQADTIATVRALHAGELPPPI
ncbi:ATP-dependent DNA ligase [Egicoccus halophilus]|uniref:Probable DNA ligase n=1 Tax=Egicoccus halophilus TaxID=1670830 RepID=A0A8J3AAE8_9ACTN|nr:ATP-dependent DNA ligase [Egicoccus halophilus]GGI06392.1 DNA ligase [Egicoccus halophilus]